MTSTQEPRNSGLLGSSAIMAAGTVVSRLTGFARAAVIASAIGLTAATADVFNVPNVIPNMIYILVGGGVLNSVLVPVLVRAIKNDADGGEAFSQRLFSLAVTVLGLTTIVAVLAAPWIMQLIVDDRFLEPGMRPYFDNMVMFARFCLPQIFFYGLYVLIGQMLNAKGRFGPMMWSPILNNVVAIAVFGVFLVVYGQQGLEPFTTTQTLLLGLGSTFGVVAQALFLLPVLRRTGYSLRFRTDWRGQGLGESVRLGLWTFGFVAINQLAYLVVVKVASGASAVDAGASGAGYSVYANAMLIMMVPHSVITVSLATALLPRLSDLASDGHFDEVRSKLVSALRMCLAVIIPLGALMAALAFPLTAMIFDHGSAEGQTERLALTLIVMMPGLIGFTIHYLVLRGFYALQDTKTPFFTQIWVSAVIMLSAVGIAVVSPSDEYVTMALAGGYSLGYLVGSAVGVVRLQRRIGALGGGELVQHMTRLAFHSFIAAGLAWLVWRGWADLGVLDGAPSIIGSLVELIIGGTVGTTVFVGLAYAFRIDEVRRAVAMIMAKLRGTPAAPAEVDPGELLEDTAEYMVPAAETGTLSIFRRPMDPDMTSEFFLDETLPGVPSFFDTTAGAARGRPGSARPLPGVTSARSAQLDRDTQPPQSGDLPPVPPPGGAVQPGQRRTIAGRYRFERLLDDSDGVHSWQAVDDVLRRAVFIQSVDANDPRAAGFVTAARVSSTVADARFLRVLDVGSDDVAYVVREWTPGQSLAVLLAAGAFHPDQAAAVTREVAEALAGAHSQGLSHRHLNPTLVFVTADGSVKIAGLETEHALRGPGATPHAPSDPGRPDPAELDAIGIGGILYAALTARWPAGPSSELAAAPLIDGRVASPRQVRPGVPTMLDTVTDRAIGQAQRHHATPLVTPYDVAAALGAGRAPRPILTEANGGQDQPPALIEEPGTPLPPSRVERRESRQSGRTSRVLGVMAATLLLVGSTLVGLQLLLGAIDDGEDPPPGTPTDGDTTQTEPTPTGDPTPLALETAGDYDPTPEFGGDGNGEENPSDVGNAVDGDPDTAWTTVNYYDPMEEQKPGVGLYIDLGEAVDVRAIQLDLLNEGSSLEIRAADPEADEAPADLDDWTVVEEIDSAEQNVTSSFDEAVTTRYVLVWFTALPLDGGNYRGGITDAEVLG